MSIGSALPNGFLIALLLPPAAFAQQHWPPLQEAVLAGRGERRIVPQQYRTVGVDTTALAAFFAQVQEEDVRHSDRHIHLPVPEGGSERFAVARSMVMHPELAERYPMIRTFHGVSTDRPGVLVRLDLTPHGFHAMVLDPHDGDWFIDPYAFGAADAGVVYRKRHFHKSLPPDVAYCTYDQVNDLEAAAAQMRAWLEAMGTERAGDCQKRTYRLALACTGEYANYHGSNTTNNNKSFALAAMATTMNRVNGVFERDLTVRLNMVANNDQIVYLNGSTDPYSNSNTSAMLGQNQTTCDNVIGSANYDIGHVFGTGGGGVAYLGSVCDNSFKAGGVTRGSPPAGDPFDIDYVAHEMGHQFGANHTQNNNCSRHGPAAFEPGSGSTIMGYAGVCSPNVQNNSDALMHGHSLQEIAAFLAGGGGACAQVSGSGNQAPTVNGGGNRTIPRSTPFVLSASASDANTPLENLTFSWEQMNNQVSTQPPVATSTGGPNFRVNMLSASPSRWFPNLNAVINNQTPTWEVLSSVGRTFNFRVNVRDNHPGAGCTAENNITVTVSGTTGPFLVTQPNTNVSWQAGSTQTVTWDVAGTSGAPVNCANVDILLSVDGGLTYPHTLATTTPNDGSQSITLPVIPATTQARVMVRANGNVFYDISNTNFTITAAPVQPTVAVKVNLEGCLVPATGLMRDSLRQQGLIPLTEPYTALGFVQVGGGGGESTSSGVLAVAGNNAIVDWVRVELRSAGDPATVMATRQGLLQRDGDVVAVDGTSPLSFAVATGSYYVAIRHRNHLGAMTASAVSLGGAPTTIDFRTPATATYGTEAQTTLGSSMALWTGNTVIDGRLAYTGDQNDRDKVLVAIGGTVPSATTSGYLQEDVNLDGVAKYVGDANDRDPILLNIGGSVPTNVRFEQLP